MSPSPLVEGLLFGTCVFVWMTVLFQHLLLYEGFQGLYMKGYVKFKEFSTGL